MKKLTTFVIILCCLIFSTSIGYYLLIYIPQKNISQEKKLLDCYQDIDKKWSAFTSADAVMNRPEEVEVAKSHIEQGKKECTNVYGR